MALNRREIRKCKKCGRVLYSSASRKEGICAFCRERRVWNYALPKRLVKYIHESSAD